MRSSEQIHDDFVMSLVTARGQLRTLVDGLFGYGIGNASESCLSGMTRPQMISWALDRCGGIICAPINFLADIDPCPEDMPIIASVCDLVAKVYDFASEVAKWMKLPRRFLKRFAFRPQELMSTGYFARHFGVRKHLTMAEYRQRVVDYVCGVIRRFLDWLRTALRNLPADFMSGPDAPIFIAPMRRKLVRVCSRGEGLLELQNPAGGGIKAYPISPRREKVWEFLRRLVGDNSLDGDVQLPGDYASHFRNTNSQNDGCRDELALVLRHIHPSRLSPGYYHLAWDSKPELKRL